MIKIFKRYDISYYVLLFRFSTFNILSCSNFNKIDDLRPIEEDVDDLIFEEE